jgi:hypothetical protein
MIIQKHELVESTEVDTPMDAQKRFGGFRNTGKV